MRAASQLLGAPAFDSLARFHDEVEEEYMPGGPPQSPVYDSFSMQFVLGSVPQGIGNETPYSVLARLLQRDPSRARLQSMAQSLADARFRQALLRTAVKEGLLDVSLRELRRLADGAESELSPNEQSLLAAYTSFGLRAKDGTTVLSRFERSRDAESMHPDARLFIDNLNNGWFTVLRVDRIHLDKGIEAFDLLRRQNLPVSERAATRQLAPGDLVLGWVCKDSAGTITLEGGIAHVPSFGAPPFMALVDQLQRAMPPLADEQAWKQSAAELPLPLIAGILELRANPPLPELVNTGGDPLELVTGHYRIREHARVRFWIATQTAPRTTCSEMSKWGNCAETGGQRGLVHNQRRLQKGLAPPSATGLIPRPRGPQRRWRLLLARPHTDRPRGSH